MLTKQLPTLRTTTKYELIPGVQSLDTISLNYAKNPTITADTVHQLRYVVEGFFDLHARKNQNREETITHALDRAISVIKAGQSRTAISRAIWLAIRPERAQHAKA